MLLLKSYLIKQIGHQTAEIPMLKALNAKLQCFDRFQHKNISHFMFDLIKLMTYYLINYRCSHILTH